MCVVGTVASQEHHRVNSKQWGSMVSLRGLFNFHLIAYDFTKYDKKHFVNNTSLSNSNFHPHFTVFSKILEHVVSDQIIAHFVNIICFAKKQSGFR